MSREIKKKGHYEWFKTEEGKHILNLNGQYYALMKGEYGNVMVKVDAEFKKDHTISEGEFYLADFNKGSETTDRLP